MSDTALNRQMIKMVPLLSLLAEQRITALFPASQRRSYARHSFIVRAGDKANGLYVILAGRAKVLIDDGDAREVILTIIGPNEFFGEMSLIDEAPRSATVQAMEPCEMLYIPKTAFMECLKDNFGAAMLMLRVAVARLREADRKIESLALMDVYGRIARLIIEEAHEENGEWVVEPGAEQIARMVAASREMVSRVLKDLREKGLIRRHKRKIIVLDRSAITCRAAGRQRVLAEAS